MLVHVGDIRNVIRQLGWKFVIFPEIWTKNSANSGIISAFRIGEEVLEKSNLKEKNVWKTEQKCIKTQNFCFFFQKTLDLAKSKNFLRKTAFLDEFYGNFDKNEEIIIFSVNFCFIVQLANFMFKNWMLINWFFLHYWNLNGRWIITNIDATIIAPGFLVHALKKPKALELFLREGSLLQQLNSSWKKFYKEGYHLGKTFYSHY